jgi:hypothetical protein
MDETTGVEEASGALILVEALSRGFFVAASSYRGFGGAVLRPDEEGPVMLMFVSVVAGLAAVQPTKVFAINLCIFQSQNSPKLCSTGNRTRR